MEFLVGTVLAVLGIAVAVYTAMRSKQMSHPDFEVCIGEQAVRSNRRNMNPDHLVYLVSLEGRIELKWFQMPYAIKNTSEKSVNDINITIDVPSEFCMKSSEIEKLLKERGASELVDDPFFKSRKVSGYLNRKRIQYKIDTLGPKQVATLAEILDISKSRFPSPVPVPTTLNTIIKSASAHKEIRALLPVHIAVSAHDIEPKTDNLFVSIINGSIDAMKSTPRGKRKVYSGGEYVHNGTEVAASSISLQNYVDSFWLGVWPAGKWRPINPVKFALRRRKMMRSEVCHIVPLDLEAIEREERINHPHFSGEIASYPIRVPNIDYLSTEHNIETPDALMVHLGFRRPFKHEEIISKIGFLIYLAFIIALAGFAVFLQ